MVKDLTPGSASSSISQIAARGALVYFVDATGLWVTDGTDAGTFLLLAGSGFGTLTTSGSYVFFAYDDGTSGRELWRTDGTPTGTVMVMDVEPGPASSSPGDLSDVAGTLMFTATTTANGKELWRTTGSGASLMDVTSGPTGTGFDSFAVNGSKLYFTTTNSPATPGYESLYTAQPSGAFGLNGIGLGSHTPLVVTSGKIYYFTVNTYPNPTEVYLSSTSGSVLIERVSAGQSVYVPQYAGANNGTVYFGALDRYQGNIFLWRSDGTTAGTGIAPEKLLNPVDFKSINGNAFVRAADPYVGSETFQIIGNTLAGTSGNDTITVTDDPQGLLYNIYVNTPTSGQPTYQISRASLGTTTIDAGAGTDTLVFIGNRYCQAMTFSPTSIQPRVTSLDVLTTLGFEKTIWDSGNGGGEDQLRVNSGAAVELPSSQQLLQLSVDANGTLDLHGHDVTVSNLVYSPFGSWNGTAYTGIVGSIASGRIVTTAGKAVGSALIDGVAHIRTTYPGDANLDGKINVDDYGRIDTNIGQGTSGWFNGDFNYDGKINVDDYGIIDSNIGIQGPPLGNSPAGGRATWPRPEEQTGKDENDVIALLDPPGEHF
jgi:ELWxxDGT repeat protein